MSFFERNLSWLVLLCIIIGILLGSGLQQFTAFFAQMEIFHINIAIAFLIWILIIPMFVNINFSSLFNIKKHYKGMIITLVVNWFLKPFSMFVIGYLFVKYWFAGFLPEHDSYFAGLILLAAAPCTAMVFVWSRLVGGDASFTVVQVALNDILMLFLFAPIVSFLLGVGSVVIPFSTLLLSVIVYIVLPFVIGQSIRFILQRTKKQISVFITRTQIYSEISLLLILVCIFSFQGKVILQNPFVILLLAVPIIVQTLFNAGIAFLWNVLWKEQMSIAAPSTLIAASNFFELAVASAVSLFGIQSGAVLATVVGVLVEVPLMLSIVRILNCLKRKNLETV